MFMPPGLLGSGWDSYGCFFLFLLWTGAWQLEVADAVFSLAAPTLKPQEMLGPGKISSFKCIAILIR